MSRTDLSDRELKVFRYISEGKRYKEIGGILGISETSVQTYVYRGCIKLGAETTGSAIAMLVRGGKI